MDNKWWKRGTLAHWTGLRSSTDYVGLNVLEELGTRPNVMNLLLFRVTATPSAGLQGYFGPVV